MSLFHSLEYYSSSSSNVSPGISQTCHTTGNWQDWTLRVYVQYDLPTLSCLWQHNHNAGKDEVWTFSHVSYQCGLLKRLRGNLYHNRDRSLLANWHELVLYEVSEVWEFWILVRILNILLDLYESDCGCSKVQTLKNSFHKSCTLFVHVSQTCVYRGTLMILSQIHTRRIWAFDGDLSWWVCLLVFSLYEHFALLPSPLFHEGDWISCVFSWRWCFHLLLKYVSHNDDTRTSQSPYF